MPSDLVKQLCDTNIEHFMQYVSLDSGIREHAEYIRHGLTYFRMHENVHRFLDKIPNRNSLTFIITMNNLGVTGFREYMEWILRLRETHSKTYQRVWFDTPVLRQPAWQSLQILPESYAAKLEQCADWMATQVGTNLTGFRDYEVQRLRRDIAWMREGQNMDPTLLKQRRADFYRFFAEHDRRRGTDFLKTFPEMKSWWAECEHHAKNS